MILGNNKISHLEDTNKLVSIQERKNDWSNKREPRGAWTLEEWIPQAQTAQPLSRGKTVKIIIIITTIIKDERKIPKYTPNSKVMKSQRNGQC